MATADTAYWLTPERSIYFVDSATAPTIIVHDADGNTASLHLNAGELHGEQGRQDAIAALDALAGACIAAYRAIKARELPAEMADSECFACAARKRTGQPSPILAGCPDCETWRAYRANLTGRDPRQVDDDDDDDDDAIAAHELVRVPNGPDAFCLRCRHPHSSPTLAGQTYCFECPCFVFVSPTAPVAAENELRALAGDR